MKKFLSKHFKVFILALILLSCFVIIGVSVTYPIIIAVVTKSMWWLLLYVTVPITIPFILLVLSTAVGVAKLIIEYYE